MAEAFEVVESVEVEWDDRQRDRMLALALYREGLCRQCGYHKSLHHPRYHFAVELEYCQIRAALDRYDRIQRDAAEQAANGPKPPPGAPQAGDGQQTVVRLKPPSERVSVSAR